MSKKIIKAIFCILPIIAIVLFCILLPNQKEVNISEEDYKFLSSITWNDKQTLLNLGFVEYTNDNFTLDYGKGHTMRITLNNSTNDNSFELEINESANKGKFSLWFSSNPSVQRKGFGKYKNAELYINEINDAHHDDSLEFISFFKQSKENFS